MYNFRCIRCIIMCIGLASSACDDEPKTFIIYLFPLLWWSPLSLSLSPLTLPKNCISRAFVSLITEKPEAVEIYMDMKSPFYSELPEELYILIMVYTIRLFVRIHCICTLYTMP